MKLQILSRSKKPLVPGGLEIDPEATVQDLKKHFYVQTDKYHPSRQRFTLPPAAGQKSGKPLDENQSLASQGLKDGSEIYFKDLGPQIGYSTVFFWEYLGPLVVYPIFFFFPHLYWWNSSALSRHLIQKLALGFWSFHYIKRLLETFFVHRFSRSTMPLLNLFKNCGYYWGFAAYLSYFVNHPFYTPPSMTQAILCFAFGVISELSNFWCHLIQRNLRSPGSGEYQIPKGFLFNYITCANYTTEIAAWCLFTVATQTFASGIFTLAGAIQMAQWAHGKHKRLAKTFNGEDGKAKYPKRWKMIPLLF